MKYKNCVGCYAIKNKIFPFRNLSASLDDKNNWLDDEGCISEDGLLIYYCPVCGSRLYNNVK